MPGIKRGSTGNSVKALQELLNKSGANLKVDGIYGPATEAAVRKYQKDNGYQQNGQVGTTLFGIMDLPAPEGGSSGGVASSSTGSELLLQGEWELWYNSDTKSWIAVKPIPGVVGPDGKKTEDSFISWKVESDEDLEAVVGVDITPKAKRTVSNDDLTKMGMVDFGGVDELRDWGGFEGDPLDTWEADMAQLAITRPWILEADWQNLTVSAIFEREDPTLTLDEIQTTNWYRTHTDDQRRWMEIDAGDPATAAQWMADSQEAVAIKLRNAGINNMPPELADYIASQVVTGNWSQDKLDYQIRAISDPYSNIDPDQGLLSEMAALRYSPDATQEKEDSVRNLLTKWLGPVYGNWTDKQIAEKAGDLRNDPDAEGNLIESLKDQRVAMIPGVENRETSYQDLAAPWRNFQRQVWGTQEVDETEGVFTQMLNQNDATENGALLNREGLKRNIGKVINDTRADMSEAWGSSIR